MCIDVFMGNSRWIRRQLLQHARSARSIVELGAGEGHLCAKVEKTLPQSHLTGLDLMPRPPAISSSTHWISGDFFESIQQIEGDACIGSLILHHFPESALAALGEHLKNFRLLVFCEPLRSRASLSMAMLALPLVGKITRHDMPVSIRAGFRPTELAHALRLDTQKWIVRESITWRGSLRLVALRR
jgi:hypothetical protein